MTDEDLTATPSPQPPTAPSTPGQQPWNAKDRAVTGAILLIIGLFVFIGQLTSWDVVGWLLFPILAAILLGWGLISRNFGFVIPGGIFAGLGLGMFTMLGPLGKDTAAIQPGLFLACFGLGWVLITLLSPITDGRWVWWPLIPGAAIGLTGAALMAGSLGQSVLKLASYTWPLILVAVGAYLLLVRKRE